MTYGDTRMEDNLEMAEDSDVNRYGEHEHEHDEYCSLAEGGNDMPSYPGAKYEDTGLESELGGSSRSTHGTGGHRDQVEIERGG
ncbi:hypothetical protein GN244_ATG18889 [Phytophthora infestans]|uniref:Uncharacterized protein n=1 Tax=Phytophthora infestans TaxID=4787 RepID=A0A833SKH2_PHYIN|nr:hypothetical protein GN244_ATG18889 [Phytophthora infestans]KAF4147312.1 hypothetical protein GN958_ATG03492 [Phytophthora infestans]